MIIRTAAASVPLKEIEAELRELYQLWGEIYRQYKTDPAPHLLYEDVGMVERVLRDYLDGTNTFNHRQ